MHLVVSPVHPESWPVLVRLRLDLADVPGALARATDVPLSLAALMLSRAERIRHELNLQNVTLRAAKSGRADFLRERNCRRWPALFYRLERSLEGVASGSLEERE